LYTSLNVESMVTGNGNYGVSMVDGSSYEGMGVTMYRIGYAGLAETICTYYWTRTLIIFYLFFSKLCNRFSKSHH